MGGAPYKSAKEGGGRSLTVSAFNHERAPKSCLQRLKVLKANNWTQNKVQRNHQQVWSRVLMAHNTPNGTMSDGEHSVARGAHPISYVLLHKDALHWFRRSITQCFLPEIRLEAMHVLLKLHAKLASVWALIRVNFDPIQEIAPKAGGGRSFVGGPFFARLYP